MVGGDVGVVGAGVVGVVGAGDPEEDPSVPEVSVSVLGTSGSFAPLAKTCVETQRESNEIKTNFLLNCFILKLLNKCGRRPSMVKTFCENVEESRPAKTVNKTDCDQ